MAGTFKEGEDMDILDKHLCIMRLERTRSRINLLKLFSQEHSFSAMINSRPPRDRVGLCLSQVVKLIPESGRIERNLWVKLSQSRTRNILGAFAKGNQIKSWSYCVIHNLGL